jgi:hypothetical protein
MHEDEDWNSFTGSDEMHRPREMEKGAIFAHLQLGQQRNARRHAARSIGPERGKGRHSQTGGAAGLMRWGAHRGAS